MPRLLVAFVLIVLVPARVGAGSPGGLSRVLPAESEMRAELADHCRMSARELAVATVEFRASLRRMRAASEQEEVMRAWNDEHRRILDELKAVQRCLARRDGDGREPVGGIDSLYRDWHRYRRLRAFLPLAMHWWDLCAAEDFKTEDRVERWAIERAALSRELESLAAVVAAATAPPALQKVEADRRRAALVPNRPGTREALARIRKGTSLLDRKEDWTSLTQEEKDRLLIKRNREQGSRD